MAVWSDADILAAVAAGTFKAEPWHPQDLTPNGLDLRVAHVVVPSLSPDPLSAGLASVPSMTRFVVATEAVLTMPQDAVGSLWIRSSYARRGVLASFGKVDAGFRGNLTFGAFHAGHEPLSIPIGDRFCQIVLESLRTAPTKDYGAKGGRYQDQRGVTMAKP